jgi:hypothetical protein
MAKITEYKRTEREQKAFEFWLKNPVDAVKTWFGATPDDHQGDILNALFGKQDRVAVKSAHGAGKSTAMSWAGWIFLNCYIDSRVVATAPTFSQLHDALWPEFAKWRGKMPSEMKNEWRISGGHIRHKINENTWFAVSRTSNKPENMQGFHNQHILIVGDEASGIPQNVFEVIEGTLSEAGQEGRVAKLALTGNPNFNAGEFYDAFHKHQELYYRVTVSGCPDFLPGLGIESGEIHKEHGKCFYAPRVTKKYRMNMERKYGKDGAVYDVRVRGVFPRMDDFAVIALSWAQAATTIPLPDFDQQAHGCTIVLDVARFGGDETVEGIFRCGVPILPFKTWAKTSTEQCVDILVEAVRKVTTMGLRVDMVIVDEPGIGGGVIDAARRRGVPVTPYNGGGTMTRGADPDEDVRMFLNRRSRDWWSLRRKMELGLLPIPDDDVLVAQLASVRYDYSENQKILVESKRRIRERLGDGASPDRADVLVMGTAPWYSTGATNTSFTKSDIILGDERAKAELDLW